MGDVHLLSFEFQKLLEIFMRLMIKIRFDELFLFCLKIQLKINVEKKVKSQQNGRQSIDELQMTLKKIVSNGYASPRN